MANMFLAGYFLRKSFEYFKESEPIIGSVYIGLVILNIVLGFIID